MSTLQLARGDARHALLAAVGLSANAAEQTSFSALVAQRAHVQIDPLDPFGNNADLVAMARGGEFLRGCARPDERTFEHYAKERCFLPREAFPFYRALASHRPDFRARTVPAS